MHVHVCQQLQLDSCLLKESVPTQTWRAVVMRPVQPVFLLANLSEIFKHVCQQHRVCDHVQVVVIPKISESECLPDLFGVRIVFICYAFSAEARVELFFLRELSLLKPFKRVHVLVRVDAFLQQLPPLVFFWDHSMHDWELIASLHQLVKAAEQKIHAVDTSL